MSTFSESLQLLKASSAIHELQIYAAITAFYTPELQRTFRIVSVTPVSPVPAYKSDIFILVLLWDCHVNHESSLLYCSELYPASSGFFSYRIVRDHFSITLDSLQPVDKLIYPSISEVDPSLLVPVNRACF